MLISSTLGGFSTGIDQFFIQISPPRNYSTVWDIIFELVTVAFVFCKFRGISFSMVGYAVGKMAFFFAPPPIPRTLKQSKNLLKDFQIKYLTWKSLRFLTVLGFTALTVVGGQRSSFSWQHIGPWKNGPPPSLRTAQAKHNLSDPSFSVYLRCWRGSSTK